MSESKFTPGPWRIGTPGPNGCYTIGTVRGLMTAMIAHSRNEPDQAIEAMSNAKLIAAAPCLLEALESLMRVVANPDCAEGLALGSARAKATAAIQKATA